MICVMTNSSVPKAAARAESVPGDATALRMRGRKARRSGSAKYDGWLRWTRIQAPALKQKPPGWLAGLLVRCHSDQPQRVVLAADVRCK